MLALVLCSLESLEPAEPLANLSMLSISFSMYVSRTSTVMPPPLTLLVTSSIIWSSNEDELCVDVVSDPEIPVNMSVADTWTKPLISMSN